VSQGVQVTALAVQAITPLFMVLVARCVKGRRATHLLKMRLHVRAYLLHTLSPSPAKLGGWLGGAHAALPPAIASHHVTPCDATKRGALLLPQCPEPGVPFHCRLPDEGGNRRALAVPTVQGTAYRVRNGSWNEAAYCPSAGLRGRH